MKIQQRTVSKVFGLALLTLCSTKIYAAPITGQVNLNATVGVSASTIDFYSLIGSACGIASPGVQGCFGINNPSDGNFASLALGYQLGNLIKDLSGPPITGNIALSQFLVFNNNIIFDLTRVLPGTGPACDPTLGNNPGYTCTPSVGGNLSPFTLQNSAAGPNNTAPTNASVSFNVEVLAYLTDTIFGTSNYVGAFSTQAAGMNIAGILSTINPARTGGGGTVVAAYSANFNGTPNNPVPEPATLGTLGIGLAAIVLGGLRKKARSVK